MDTNFPRRQSLGRQHNHFQDSSHSTRTRKVVRNLEINFFLVMDTNYLDFGSDSESEDGDGQCVAMDRYYDMKPNLRSTIDALSALHRSPKWEYPTALQ